MSSTKQIKANRRNAQKSAQRQASSRRKHAAPRIESIARAICPETANAGLWEQGLIIGQCATVLGCVQAERIALIEQLLGGTTAQSRTGGVAVQARPLPHELEALGLAARDLNRLERYEREALSRRKRATETFMAINHMP